MAWTWTDEASEPDVQPIALTHFEQYADLAVANLRCRNGFKEVRAFFDGQHA
jgi:hypothetical protein